MLLLDTQDAHLQTITEVLQSIKASEMTPLLTRIYGSPGGSELLDVLMKYMYENGPSPKPALGKETRGSLPN